MREPRPRNDEAIAGPTCVTIILRELERCKESVMSAKDIFSEYEPVFLRHAAFALGVLRLLVVRVPGPVPRTVIDITKSASGRFE
jgi:hypothetical protein